MSHLFEKYLLHPIERPITDEDAKIELICSKDHPMMDYFYESCYYRHDYVICDTIYALPYNELFCFMSLNNDDEALDATVTMEINGQTLTVSRPCKIQIPAFVPHGHITIKDVKTPGGNIYHSGDSHFSIGFAKHGKEHDIDVAFGSFCENPIGIQDKMTSVDILRMAESLRCKVVIPIHHDVWSNFQADTEEIRLLYDFKKPRNNYQFHPFFWQVGGQYTYPQDKDMMYYHHPRGFDDYFENPRNVPFDSIL